MARSSWQILLQDLHQADNISAATKAARKLCKEAGAAQVPDLYALMDDERFFVREAAASALGRLEGIRALPILFQALQRGEQEGHDNDDLTLTIIELLEDHKAEVTPQLLHMLTSSDTAVRADAAWALGFVAAEVTSQPLFDLLNHDPDPEVRAIAAASLQSFIGTAAATGSPLVTHSQEVDSFNGNWFWQDCAPPLQYGFHIQGMTGTCLQTNAPTFSVGDVILKIGLVSGPAFVGQQIFTNGMWYPVTGRMEADLLHMQGGGQMWQLQKVG